MKSKMGEAIAEIQLRHKLLAERIGLKTLLTELKSDVKDLGFTMSEVEDIIESDPVLSEKLGFHFDRVEKAGISFKTAVKQLVAAAKELKRETDDKKIRR